MPCMQLDLACHAVVLHAVINSRKKGNSVST